MTEPAFKAQDNRVVRVVTGKESFEVSRERPFVFGREEQDGIVGLDASDMGISAEAGSIEEAYGVWWLVNRSRKRRLLIEVRSGHDPIRVACGDRQALTSTPIVVLVPGAVFTHRLEVHLPADALLPVRPDTGATTGTITNADLGLSDRDLEALTSLCSGYLQSFPRRDPRPLTYSEAAKLLGGDWNATRVRKQVERIKERLAKRDLFFDGPRANDLLAAFLLENRYLTVSDLDRLGADK
jgi:hypothetical protein